MSNQGLVFIVDDDVGILKGIKRLLKQHGFDSALFDSAEAFESCDDFDAAICIILDIQLNGVSGIEVRHRLIDAGIALPVIYITANDNDAVRAAAVKSGCIAYLTKPFAAKSLIEPIERVAAARAH
ncbi:response regulator [Bradyrhizobium sp.]|uniref:response regulator transcription factor n=1 Tax=Bradyrhizobium sp. TaxID=376 RepID=UPI001E17B70D|nr:response regulator [Bradyrhizobium sp.]MBV8697493.1 response regulator [Bradyrhizobium sp.]MBV8923234.1 response regulator [Bradyrhizobium sp.]MBV9985862.1 response regulator [Bradyrhizobium sp.]